MYKNINTKRLKVSINKTHDWNIHIMLCFPSQSIYNFQQLQLSCNRWQQYIACAIYWSLCAYVNVGFAVTACAV